MSFHLWVYQETSWGMLGDCKETHVNIVLYRMPTSDLYRDDPLDKVDLYHTEYWI